MNRLKYAEVKIFSICVDLYKKYEGDNYDMWSFINIKKQKIEN